MTETVVAELGQDALLMTLTLCLPAMAVALTVGLVISVIQAATQVNEATLSFVPKILAVFLTLALLGSWMLSRLTSYAAWLLGNLANFVG